MNDNEPHTAGEQQAFEAALGELADVVGRLSAKHGGGIAIAAALQLLAVIAIKAGTKRGSFLRTVGVAFDAVYRQAPAGLKR